MGEEVAFEGWGFTATELTPALVRRAQLPTQEGVLVSGVQVGGIAANATLRRGDIIRTVDGVVVENLASFKRLYDKVVGVHSRLVLLDVKRGALDLFVLVKQEGAAEPASPGGTNGPGIPR